MSKKSGGGGGGWGGGRVSSKGGRTLILTHNFVFDIQSVGMVIISVLYHTTAFSW